MAIIKCPECGKEVSDKAKTCIHCGAPLVKENSSKVATNNEKPIDVVKKDEKKPINKKMILMIGAPVLVIVVAIVLFSIFSNSIAGTYKYCSGNNPTTEYTFFRDKKYTHMDYTTPSSGTYEINKSIITLISDSSDNGNKLYKKGNYIIEADSNYDGKVTVESGDKINGNTITRSDYNVQSYYTTKETIVFRSDGTYTYSRVSTSDWMQPDFTYTLSSRSNQGKYKISNNVLTLTTSSEEMTYYIYDGYVYDSVFKKAK